MYSTEPPQAWSLVQLLALAKLIPVLVAYQAQVLALVLGLVFLELVVLVLLVAELDPCYVLLIS